MYYTNKQAWMWKLEIKSVSCASFPQNKSTMAKKQHRFFFLNYISLHTFSSRKGSVKDPIYVFPVAEYINQPDFYYKIVSC